MPRIGSNDEFESNYMADLRAVVVRHGELIEYPKDRAALDLGLHLKRRVGDKVQVTQARVWMQAKGLRSITFTPEVWAKSADVPVAGLEVEHVKFWYGSAEPVYLVLFIECVGTFLAADVRDLVDALGGLPYLLSLGSQQTITLRIPQWSTLEAALAQMPSHRSMRVDGPAFRGRPLGHNFDPLRSELNPLPPAEFIKLVDGLLQGHEFRGTSEAVLQEGILARIGTLYLTYEWVLPMMTEFGFGEGTNFRIEGEPFHAHGDVLIVIDPSAHVSDDIEAQLQGLVEHAQARGATAALVFINAPEGDLSHFFAAWRNALEPLQCMPQAMGSLTFNVLTTTNLYLDVAPKLTYRFINYRY